MSAPPWMVPLSDVVGDDELVARRSRRCGRAGGARARGLPSSRRGSPTSTGRRTRSPSRTARRRCTSRSSPLGVGPGDEVILPSLTFVAAANRPAHRRDAVFCDIRRRGRSQPRPGRRRGGDHPRTKAIVALHYGGFPCDMDAVLAIAERHGSPWSRTRRTRSAAAATGAPAARSARSAASASSRTRTSRSAKAAWSSTGDATSPRAPATAVARNDHADLGPPSRSREHVRRRRAGLQLPARRDPRRHGARPARAAARRDRAACAARRPLRRAACTAWTDCASRSRTDTIASDRPTISSSRSSPRASTERVSARPGDQASRRASTIRRSHAFSAYADTPRGRCPEPRRSRAGS